MALTPAQRSKSWRQNNKAKTAASHRAWREANLDKARAYEKAYAIAWYRKNRDRILASRKANYKNDQRRKHTLQSKYGMSVDTYNQKIVDQHNKCASCDDVFTSTPCVDHNHVTGKNRGLLCHNCNRALGLLGENPRTLSRLIEYLDLWKNQEGEIAQ